MNTNVFKTIAVITAIFTLVLPIITAAAGSNCAPLPSGVVSWWTGNQTADDILGRNNGVLQNGATYAVGEVSDAFSFNDNLSAYVSVPDSPSLNIGTGDFSMEAWVKANSPKDIATIMDKRDVNAPVHAGYHWYLDYLGYAGLQITDSNGTSLTIDSNVFIPDGHFHHLAVTVVRASQTGLKFFVDGQLVNTYNPTGLQGNLDSSASFLIGGHHFDSWRTFNGIIDELSLYKRALTESEILAIYNAGSAGKCKSTAVTSSIVSLGDINHDNSPELAVVTYDATLKKSRAKVRNAKTGVLVKQITFNGQYAPVKANTVNDLNGNGAAEIAVLGVRGSDQTVQVEIHDSLSGARLRSVPFPSDWPPLDLGIVRNVNGPGTAALAVLQQSTTGVRVQLKDAKSGVQLRTIPFSPGFDGVDLVVLGDLNGNQTKDLAVLLDNPSAKGADSVEIRDSGDGQLIRSISYGSGATPKQLASMADANGNGFAELAVLRENTKRVAVKDAQTGLAVNTLDYSLSQPYKLAGVPDAVQDVTDLAMLGVRASDGQIRADVHSVLTDSLVGKAVYDNYGTNVGFISIPDINGNGVAELVRLREQPGPQKLFAEIRDGRTGQWLQGMYF